MANAQDHNTVGCDAVADYIGPNGDHLASATRGSMATRKFTQAVCGGDQSQTHSLCGDRVKSPDIGADRLQFLLGFEGPNHWQVRCESRQRNALQGL
jgi:hypothetical protein